MDAQPNQNTQAGNNGNAPAKGKNRMFLIGLIVLVAGGGFFGFKQYEFSLKHETTEDAQIEANLSPVIPRASGYVTKIFVSDNQKVKKGDTLFILDDRDAKIKLLQAQAALEAAQSNRGVAQATTQASQSTVPTYQANVQTVDAQIEAAKVTLWRAEQDYNRYANLIKDHSVTQQQYEQVQATKETAEKQLKVLQEQKNAAEKQTTAAANQSKATSTQIKVADATIKQREADIENAMLNLTYTVVIAPEDGMLSKINIHNGQYVQAGQLVFNIVSEKAVWVVANFKETQLDKMVEGQKVLVHVDAFPERDLEAKLTSFSPATGARFALLPPDNASGNFVKVVQRVPVKIEFDNPNDEIVKKLRPGLNVFVDVHIDNK